MGDSSLRMFDQSTSGTNSFATPSASPKHEVPEPSQPVKSD
jgi:hypothetical protein